MKFPPLFLGLDYLIVRVPAICQSRILTAKCISVWQEERKIRDFDVKIREMEKLMNLNIICAIVKKKLLKI